MNRLFSRIFRTALWISLLLTAQCVHAQRASEGKNFSREAMSRAIAQKVIASGYARLGANCRALVDDIERFNASADQAALDHARETWNAALVAADSLRCFQTGPIADRQFVSTFYFWQVLPNRIEGIVKDPSQTIDQALLENAGATVKGLYAVEYLLFDRRGGQPVATGQREGARPALRVATPSRVAGGPRP